MDAKKLNTDSLEKAEEQLRQSEFELEATVESTQREIEDYSEQINHVNLAHEVMLPEEPEGDKN